MSNDGIRNLQRVNPKQAQETTRYTYLIFMIRGSVEYGVWGKRNLQMTVCLICVIVGRICGNMFFKGIGYWLLRICVCNCCVFKNE